MFPIRTDSLPQSRMVSVSDRLGISAVRVRLAVALALAGVFTVRGKTGLVFY